MNTSIYQKGVFRHYHSKSQIARVLTETWFENEMYCPHCLNEELSRNPNNTKVTDFACNKCGNEYQLKSQSSRFSSKITDGAFKPMIESIRFGTTPNFSFMHYSKEAWQINNLFLIPKFFFSESIIEKRTPLSSTARRAGWQGCNILLSNLPELGKVFIIQAGNAISKTKAHGRWKEVYFMNKQDYKSRAWTSDILFCIHKLHKKEFTLSEVYDFEDHLYKLHPDNHHVKDKIRQQLQILRDRGLLKFSGQGNYQTKY